MKLKLNINLLNFTAEKIIIFVKELIKITICCRLNRKEEKKAKIIQIQ